MHSSPPVIVKKSGFLTALFHGIFGFLAVVVVCATIIGFYGVNVADRKIGDVMTIGQALFSDLPEIQTHLRDALPPALAEAFNDRRDPNYRANLDISARMAGENQAIVEVTNNGKETVTMLAMRVVCTDAKGESIRACTTYAATPLAIENEWPGPLLPGETTIIPANYWRGRPADEVEVIVEVKDLRIWEPQESPKVQTSVTPQERDELASYVDPASM